MIKTKSPARKAPSRDEVQAKILNRISRIEGQLRGVRKMVEGGKSCVDVVTQVSAIKAAVSMLGMEIFRNDLDCKRKEHKAIDEAYLKTLFKMS